MIGGKVAIRVDLEVMLAKQKMSLTELSDQAGITLANLSILKTGKAKAIHIATRDAICCALNCQPGDLLVYEEGRGGNVMSAKHKDKRQYLLFQDLIHLNKLCVNTIATCGNLINLIFSHHN